ncbi:MAG: hypothetical protein MZW92_31475 [Comamonadaceae bacterium]|nr:hypothetical protein [Comamonadaceae bacterium]
MDEEKLASASKTDVETFKAGGSQGSLNTPEYEGLVVEDYFTYPECTDQKKSMEELVKLAQASETTQKDMLVVLNEF